MSDCFSAAVLSTDMFDHTIMQIFPLLFYFENLGLAQEVTIDALYTRPSHQLFCNETLNKITLDSSMKSWSEGIVERTY